MLKTLNITFITVAALALTILQAAGSGFISPAWAQLTSTGPSSQISPGRKLSSDAVRMELERRLSGSPSNEAAIWNTGYDFFRHYPKNQDTAKAIKDGFLKTRSTDPRQREILLKAAIYWEKIHDYGISNVPAGQNLELTQRKYYGRNVKQSTLPPRQAGSVHRGFPDYEWPGRHIGKGQSRSGRPANQYPGKYHQGMYPP